MTTATTLSKNAQTVLDAIIACEGKNAAEVAKFAGVSVSTVTGSLATLKKLNLVSNEDGILKATAEAEFGFGSPVTSTPVVPTAKQVSAFPTIASVTAKDTKASAASNDDDNDENDEGGTTTGVVAATTTKAAKVVKTVEPKEPVITKAMRAREVFEANKDQPRKILMDLLMATEIGLTKNGANTYIYNMRKKAGMVTARTAKDTTAEVASTETPAANAESSTEEKAAA